MTLGTFDLFHVGHVNLLRQCRDIAGSGTVGVALNTDAFVESFKHHAPVVPLEQRRAVVDACRYVDSTYVNDQTVAGSPARIVLDMKPEIIVVGSDWQGRDYLGQLGLTPEQVANIDIRYVPYTAGISSSMIREAMR